MHVKSEHRKEPLLLLLAQAEMPAKLVAAQEAVKAQAKRTGLEKELCYKSWLGAETAKLQAVEKQLEAAKRQLLVCFAIIQKGHDHMCHAARL